jgi:hypothetical protein
MIMIGQTFKVWTNRRECFIRAVLSIHAVNLVIEGRRLSFSLRRNIPNENNQKYFGYSKTYSPGFQSIFPWVKNHFDLQLLVF